MLSQSPWLRGNNLCLEFGWFGVRACEFQGFLKLGAHKNGLLIRILSIWPRDFEDGARVVVLGCKKPHGHTHPLNHCKLFELSSESHRGKRAA